MSKDNYKLIREFTVENIDTGERETFLDIELMNQHKTLTSSRWVGRGTLDTINADGISVDFENDGTFKILELGKRYREVKD